MPNAYAGGWKGGAPGYRAQVARPTTTGTGWQRPVTPVQQPQRNGSLHVPAGTSLTAAGPADLWGLQSGHGGAAPVEDSLGFEHRVHDDRELSGDGDGGSLEADLLPQLQAPGAQAAVRLGARQDHGRGFVEQPPEMGVPAS